MYYVYTYNHLWLDGIPTPCEKTIEWFSMCVCMHTVCS